MSRKLTTKTAIACSQDQTQLDVATVCNCAAASTPHPSLPPPPPYPSPNCGQQHMVRLLKASGASWRIQTLKLFCQKLQALLSRTKTSVGRTFEFSDTRPGRLGYFNYTSGYPWPLHTVKSPSFFKPRERQTKVQSSFFFFFFNLLFLKSPHEIRCWLTSLL